MSGGAGSGLVASLRGMALLFCWANLAITLPFVTMVSGAARLGGLLAAATLASCALYAHQTRRFGWATDALMVGALLALGYSLGTPSRSLGVFFAFMLVRSLYGTSRQMSAAALAAAGGYVLVLLVAGGGDLSVLAGSVVPAGLLVLAAAVLQALWRSVTSFEASAERARALAEAALELRDSREDEQVWDTLARAAERLFGHAAAVGAVIDGQVVPAGRGPRAAAMPLAALPPDVRAALEQGRAAATGQVSVRAGGLAPRPGMGGPAVLMVPIAHSGGLHGLLAVADPSSPSAGSDREESAMALAAEAGGALRRSAAAAAAARRDERVRAIVDKSPDVIALVDAQGKIGYVSPVVASLLGRSPAELVDRPFALLVEPGDAAEWDAFAASLSAGQRAALGCRLRGRDPEARHVEISAINLLGDATVEALVLTIRDVTNRKSSEDALVHHVNHDSLTQLPNRRLFLDRTADTLARAERADAAAVLFIDLDGFKAINDRYSHAAGDALLQQVAERLRGCLRPSDTAARLSGDEFAILLANLPDGAEASRVAERVRQALLEPFTAQDKLLGVGASIGVAVGGCGDDAADLLHQADLAMYAAKRRSGNAIEVRLPDDHEQPDRRAQLAGELPGAIRSGQLALRYQPVTALADGRIVAVEALARWEHPDLGLLSPAAFLLLAEDRGLIDEVLAAVLAQACSDAAEWAPAGTGPPVSVNLSAGQLAGDSLVALVTAALSAAELPPRLLILEVPQQAVARDPRGAEAAMTALARLGVRLLIDGFSSEHPPLPILRRLPIDSVKLDPASLPGRDGGPSSLPGLIQVVGELGLAAIGKGVQRRHQQDALRSAGCAFAQGHLLSRPLRRSDLDALLSAAASHGSAESPVAVLGFGTGGDSTQPSAATTTRQ